MAGDGKTSGNGSTSPFGNGQGGNAGGPMAGVDFVKNPGGNAPGGKGIDFVTNPGGSGPSGPKPTDFAAGQDVPKQKSGQDPDLDKGSIPSGNGGQVPMMDVPANSPRKGDIGVGSIGNNKKPFRLGGG